MFSSERLILLVSYLILILELRTLLICLSSDQVRCKDARLCSTKGVTVVVTDQKISNGTDLVLNGPAFTAMAKAGSAQILKENGLVDIEYKRVPCNYKKKNLSVRVEEGSSKPNNLTIKFLYQGGQTDIVAVDVATFGGSNWRYMTRVHGPVWSTAQAPAGPLQLRMVVTGGYDGKWVWAQKEVLPVDWAVGKVYDSGVQISDIAQEGCDPCDTDVWK